MDLENILELHKKWLNEEEGGVRADLSNADLRGANLTNADLSHANLTNANLRYATLTNARLVESTLVGANLVGANLNNADLRSANLNDADLRYANLNNADLRSTSLLGTDLTESDLSGANLDYSCLPLWCGSIYANMDDRQVKQLLYHVLSIVKRSHNVSDALKEKLLTEQNLSIARESHRADVCF